MRTIKELHILFREAVSDTFFIWRKEAGRVVRDQGVLIFFILVPVLYPLLYAFIYTGETVRGSPGGGGRWGEYGSQPRLCPQGRCFSRCKKSWRGREIWKRRKELMRRTKAYGIIRIPDDFSRKVNRMQQAYVGLYCDMSGLLLLQSAADGVYGRVFGYEHRIADQTDGEYHRAAG